MAKKDNKIYWIIGVIILGLIINNSNLFSIYTPKSPAGTSDYINKYYFPTSKTAYNSDVCSKPNVILGTTFQFDITTTPKSTDCMLINNNYYKVTRSASSTRGSCADLKGTPVLINKKNPFPSVTFLQVGADYYFCQNIVGGKYKYTKFSPSKVKTCSIKYTIPEVEIQSKYYCDSRTGTIYQLPCGRQTKVLMEVCEKGCEKVIKNISAVDNPSITQTQEVVKCVGDYKPDAFVNKCLNTTTAMLLNDGVLTTKECCGCTYGRCMPCTDPKYKNIQCTPGKKECKLLSGGKGQINVFYYNPDPYFGMGFEALKALNKTVPYNEFTYNLYLECPIHACDGIVKMKENDIRFGFGPVGPRGAGDGFSGLEFTGEVPGRFQLDDGDGAGFGTFYHETGHLFLNSCCNSRDGTIMSYSYNGGPLYSSSQINVIRQNLKGNYSVWISPEANCPVTWCDANGAGTKIQY